MPRSIITSCKSRDRISTKTQLLDSAFFWNKNIHIEWRFGLKHILPFLDSASCLNICSYHFSSIPLNGLSRFQLPKASQDTQWRFGLMPIGLATRVVPRVPSRWFNDSTFVGNLKKQVGWTWLGKLASFIHRKDSDASEGMIPRLRTNISQKIKWDKWTSEVNRWCFRYLPVISNQTGPWLNQPVVEISFDVVFESSSGYWMESNQMTWSLPSCPEGSCDRYHFRKVLRSLVVLAPNPPGSISFCLIWECAIIPSLAHLHVSKRYVIYRMHVRYVYRIRTYVSVWKKLECLGLVIHPPSFKQATPSRSCEVFRSEGCTFIAFIASSCDNWMFWAATAVDKRRVSIHIQYHYQVVVSL